MSLLGQFLPASGAAATPESSPYSEAGALYALGQPLPRAHVGPAASRCRAQEDAAPRVHRPTQATALSVASQQQLLFPSPQLHAQASSTRTTGSRLGSTCTTLSSTPVPAATPPSFSTVPPSASAVPPWAQRTLVRVAQYCRNTGFFLSYWCCNKCSWVFSLSCLTLRKGLGLPRDSLRRLMQSAVLAQHSMRTSRTCSSLTTLWPARRRRTASVGPLSVSLFTLYGTRATGSLLIFVHRFLPPPLPPPPAGMVLLGSGLAEPIRELLTYAHETKHDKITRALGISVALIMCGREEQADVVIEQMCGDQARPAHAAVAASSLSLSLVTPLAYSHVGHIAIELTCDPLPCRAHRTPCYAMVACSVRASPTAVTQRIPSWHVCCVPPSAIPAMTSAAPLSWPLACSCHGLRSLTRMPVRHASQCVPHSCRWRRRM